MSAESVVPPQQEEKRAEQDLLRRLAEGETDALGPLMDRYGENLMQYLTSILRNRAEAEDAFQDTWIQVSRKIDRWDASHPFSPWLFRVARNKAYDRLRRGRRWSLFSVDDSVAHAPRVELSSPATASRELVARDLVSKLLPRLKAIHREVIWLRFFQECTYEEMAEICGVPLGTIRSRLKRALDRLGALHARLDPKAGTTEHSEEGEKS